MGNDSVMRYLYRISIFMLALTGFAQMPIFKRYYIADIPGLGWLAQFYVTHALHYLFAIVLIAFAAYAVVDYLPQKKSGWRLTGSAYVRGALLAGLIITGLIMMIKNLPMIHLSRGVIIALDLMHMAICMLLLGCSLYATVKQKQWIRFEK